MFSVQTLCQFPLLRQFSGIFHYAVDPVHFAFRVFVLDSFSSFGIVFHNLSCPTVAVNIYLKVNHIVAFRDTYIIFLNEPHNSIAVEKCRQPIRKVAEDINSDRLIHKLNRNTTERFLLCFSAFSEPAPASQVHRHANPFRRVPDVLCSIRKV